MRRPSWVVVLSLSVGLLLARCSPPPEVGDLFMRLSVTPRSITDDGASANVRVTVGDSLGGARAGMVKVTAAAGSFEDGGSSIDLPLSETGIASTTWACVAAVDPACTGNLRLVARWEAGADFLEQVARIEVTRGFPTDAGSDDGGIP